MPVTTPGFPSQSLARTSGTACSTCAELPVQPKRREFKHAIWARLGLIFVAAAGFLGIAATPGYADNVVIGFDSWPSAAPPGSAVMVRGSKCGSVIDPWGGGPIEGTVSVQIVGRAGAVAGHIFYTENTIWGGALNLPESLLPGEYAITARCVPEQGNEFDYPSNTLTVVPGGGNQTATSGSNSGYDAVPASSGGGYGSTAPAPDPFTSAEYPSGAGSHTYSIGSWSTNAARLAVATLVLTGLALPLLLMYRRRNRSKPKTAQDLKNHR